MTSNFATPKQIREHYKGQGCEVRIDREQHVTFRKPGDDWREGRWVSEYRVDPEGNVYLT